MDSLQSYENPMRTSTPQQAFQLLLSARNNGLTSIYISAFQANLEIGNYRVADQLFSILESDTSIPSNLMHMLKEKLQSYDELRRILDTPIISVIIPYHNRENIIEECIHSVLNQTVTKLEVILVDDGSTDRSRDIVAKIQDRRIVRINCDKASGNSGTPRNTALKAARGNYIAFVDSDDTIDEDYFEQLLSEAIKKDAEVTIAKGFTKCYRDQHGLPKQSRINYQFVPNFVKHKPNDYFFINSFVIWDKLYKRTFLQKYDIKLADSKIGADTLMVAKTYYYANKIALCNNKAAYNYNAFSEGSVTQAFRSKGDIREEDRPYAEVFNWLTQENVPSAYVLIQWIRRLMSLSYCLSSSKFEIGSESIAYLKETLKEAPFKSVLTLLKQKKLEDQYKNVTDLLQLLGRKTPHIE